MNDKSNSNFSSAEIPTTIAPWLTVGNGNKAVAFYKAAFGASEAYRMEAPDGGLVAKLSVNGAEFWISGGPADGEDPAPGNAGENAVRMVLTVTNPDALFAQALKAGASEIFPVGEEYGWRLGRLVDIFGYHWEIGRPLDS